ncbi:hypothetical protein QNI19_21525 [Cytophagaceae bacterium DM2B3-1]|uniref:Uncharacterized protein n=1 Tax=Xanthocytophaga flava TaxID=3048013 RepID=A0ABT7CS93_9BACT|nr:hypothetical protein [Xanthocytophaga flavus]MDJ1495534.1 hypothetical protein [Xanthocytophaga flavus]
MKTVLQILFFLSFCCYGFSQENKAAFDCSKIEVIKDASGEALHCTPIQEPVVFHKHIKKEETLYRLYLRMHDVGEAYTAGQTGIILLLTQNKSIVKSNVEVFISTPSGKTYSNALIRLNASDIAKLKANGITGFSLTQYGSVIPIKKGLDGTKYMEMLNCLLSKK